MSKVYIAGKITGFDGYKEKFKEAENKLKSTGHKVMNPARLPKEFDHAEYMHICLAMIDVCDAAYFLDNWEDSVGAKMEMRYCKENKKDMDIIIEGGD